MHFHNQKKRKERWKNEGLRLRILENWFASLGEYCLEEDCKARNGAGAGGGSSRKREKCRCRCLSCNGSFHSLFKNLTRNPRLPFPPTPIPYASSAPFPTKPSFPFLRPAFLLCTLSYSSMLHTSCQFQFVITARTRILLSFKPMRDSVATVSQFLPSKDIW